MTDKSKFLTLNQKDLIKGFIVAILSSSLTALYNLLTTGVTIEKDQLTAVAIAGVTAGLGYLIKNLFTGNETPLADKPVDLA